MKHDRGSTETGHRRATAAGHGQARAERGQELPEGRLSDAHREEVIQRLNALLADEFVLYTKTLNYHWNVRGMQFHSLHEFLEEQYEKLQQYADDVAERVRTLGGVAMGSLAEFLKSTRLEEHEGPPPDPRTMLADLHADHQAVLERLREDVDQFQDKYDDEGTCNFLTDLLENQEKLAWMLRAHLEHDAH